ncbi:MAG: hypothetical protein KKD44_03065 [Proteobacteria bacterium]|nr:hypothetical protein [Pseudomonadota bacterium]
MLSTVQMNITQELALRLQPLQGQIQQILELGLRELNAQKQPGFEGASNVLEFLAGLPTPEEILNLRPSEKMRVRINELLDKNRSHGLTTDEQAEWEQYQYIEHLVRTAKAKAHLKMKES